MNILIKLKTVLFLLVFLFTFMVYHTDEKKLVAFTENNRQKLFFFNKDLKIGDNNEDVRALQKILNNNPATKVSSVGAGSAGNETDFFGVLTKNAVIKFQELYASEILYPLGLKSGTGFAGAATRLKLNSLMEKDEKSPLSIPAKNSSSSQVKNSFIGRSYKVVSSLGQDKQDAVNNSSSADLSFFGPEAVSVRVYNTSEYQVSPGDDVILTGEGFTSSSNILHLGEKRSIPNLTSSKEGSEISFTIPKDLPLGKYSIWVTNANGTSKSETIKIYIVVTDSPAERPVVEKVEPREATIDSEITVSGKGFAASGNNIYSGFGNIINISSPDGKTLKFKVSSMEQMAKLRNNKNAKNVPMEVWFYVVNNNGYNKEPASFIIKF